MAELVVLMGAGDIGKTYVGKQYSKKGYVFLNFDGLCDITSKEKFLSTIRKLSGMVNHNPNVSFVLDGYCPFLDDQLYELKKIIKYHKIRPILLFDNYKAMQERAKKLQPEYITNLNTTIKSKVGECEYACSNGSEINSFQEGMNQLVPVTEDMVLNFIEELKASNYRWDYQPIDLPFGHKINGMTDNAGEKVWNIISKWVDFKDKSVVDVGCNHAYYLFKIENAKSLTGLDKEHVIKNARTINMLKGWSVFFREFDIETQTPPKSDVLFLMNITHHLRDAELCFKKSFSACKEIICETKYSKGLLTELAESWGFELINESPSPRKGRNLLYYVRK